MRICGHSTMRPLACIDSEPRFGMSNPFTAFFVRARKHFDAQSLDSDQAIFLEAWDQLEALAIAVYRQGEASQAQVQTHRLLRARLMPALALVEHELDSIVLAHRLEAGGKALEISPFRRLVEVEEAASFVENWPAIQLLPPAREAINLWLAAPNHGRDDSQ